MISGAHTIIYSSDAEADRAFFRDVLKFQHVDAGDGWLIFKLPPAELACHPAQNSGMHEFYLICDNIADFVAAMATAAVSCSAVQEEPWGRLVHITLPGGGKLGVYQALHASPG